MLHTITFQNQNLVKTITDNKIQICYYEHNKKLYIDFYHSKGEIGRPFATIRDYYNNHKEKETNAYEEIKKFLTNVTNFNNAFV